VCSGVLWTWNEQGVVSELGGAVLRLGHVKSKPRAPRRALQVLKAELSLDSLRRAPCG